MDDILANARAIKEVASLGLFFSITCNEDVAFIREPDVVPATAGTYLGDYRIRQQQKACAKWPRATLPAGYREPVVSSVPALFVSGDTDPATPLWFTEGFVARFPNRAEVVLAHRGHTEWPDCLSDIYERFVSAGSATKLDVSTCKPESRRPFKTAAQ